MAGPPVFTAMVMVSLRDLSPSLAVNCSTYAPAIENVAAVMGAVGSANATVPGPLTFDQVVVTASGVRKNAGKAVSCP